MFDKFGEFDSAEEINRAAAAQLKEGDLGAIKTIAEENGLDSEDAEDFCTGAIDSLTTPLLAAIGKLEMESKDLGLKNMMEDWKNFLIQMCEEDDQIPGKRLRRKDRISGQRTIPESTERNCCMHRISGMEHGILRTIRHKGKEHKRNVLHQRSAKNQPDP